MVRWKSGTPRLAAVTGSSSSHCAEDMKVGCVSGVSLAPGKNWPWKLPMPSVWYSTTRSLPAVSSIEPNTGIVTETRPLSMVPLAVPMRVRPLVGIVSTGVEWAIV